MCGRQSNAGLTAILALYGDAEGATSTQCTSTVRAAWAFFTFLSHCPSSTCSRVYPVKKIFISHTALTIACIDDICLRISTRLKKRHHTVA